MGGRGLSDVTLSLVRKTYPGLDIYALKADFDAWLCDAAPPKDQGNTGGGSLYRSNNNFGSSSVVPGDPGGGGGGPAGGASAGGGGGGAGGGAAGVAAGATGVAAAASSNDQNPLDTGSPSTSAAYTTLPLIIILGIVIGIAGARMRRRAEV